MGFARDALRRHAMATAVALVAVGAAIGGHAAVAPSSQSAVAAGAAQNHGQPNVVLITTDDQRVSDLSQMPLTRARLGAAGVTFSNGLSPHPLCCPARAEILTGQYAQNNGVHSNNGIDGGYTALRDPSNHLGTWLQDAGYRTGFVGKFLNGYYPGHHGPQSGWDWFDPTVRGIYHYADFTQYNNGAPTVYRGAYITDVVRARTQNLITRWSEADDPFFIWSSYVAPHGSTRKLDHRPVPAPRHRDSGAGLPNPAQSSAAFNEADMSDKPIALRGLARRDPARLRGLHQRRIESLRSVDEAVAAIVATLADNRELDETLIIFTSDNGFMLGEHRYVGKTFAYEASLRVPFLMRGPDVPAGAVSGRVVTTVDLAPTIIDATGARPGRAMDGRSFLDASSGDEPDPSRAVLVQAGYKNRTSSAQPEWWYRGLRTPRYTYVRWLGGFEELYDRDADPALLRNLAAAPAYAEVLAVLREETERTGGCSGVATCNPLVNLPPVP